MELIDAATGWQVWGESFDCERKDIFEIQGVITRQLLASLKLQLTGEEKKRVTARYTENVEAYEAYLQGRYHWAGTREKASKKRSGISATPSILTPTTLRLMRELWIVT